MAFQFLCPQGHLLQGEESQAGQKCKCPYCYAEFLVPPPAGSPQPGGGAWQQQVSPLAAQEQPAELGPSGCQKPPYVPPQQETLPQVGPQPIDMVPVQFGPQDPTTQDTVHLYCPHGHELETPREMLGQDALCPFCQVQFRLRFEDSREYRQYKADRRAQREEKLGRAWLNWAIAAAFVVVVGVITLIAVASIR